MTKKKLAIEITDAQYETLLKLVSYGVFVLENDMVGRGSNKSTEQVTDQILEQAEKFNCGHLVNKPTPTNQYTPESGFFDNLILSRFETLQVENEYDKDSPLLFFVLKEA